MMNNRSIQQANDAMRRNQEAARHSRETAARLREQENARQMAANQRKFQQAQAQSGSSGCAMHLLWGIASILFYTLAMGIYA